MKTPILNLFSKITEATEKKFTDQEGLRAAGWKKTGSDEGYHVYTHPHHTGHEIHVHPKLHTFQHVVNYSSEHKQKGKAAEGMSELAKHLDAHSRHTEYDEHTRSEARRKLPGGDWS